MVTRHLYLMIIYFSYLVLLKHYPIGFALGQISIIMCENIVKVHNIFKTLLFLLATVSEWHPQICKVLPYTEYFLTRQSLAKFV